MILIDYSQVSISNVLAFQKDLKNAGLNQLRDMLRHSTLSTIKYYKRKFSKDFGEVVLCCDSKEYWRKGVFPEYKASRKKNRAKSDLDWHAIFDTLDEIKNEIRANFPYKVVEVLGAEADDVIATLAKWVQENRLTRQGLFMSPEPIMIVSGDHDFKQLHLLKGKVQQYSPLEKKLIPKPQNTDFLIEHIVRGDRGDGVPNILSPNNVFVMAGARQKPLKEERLQEFFLKGKDECQNDEERTYWDRNQQLVDFDYIPKGISTAIIESYLNSKVTGNKAKIFQYLMDHRCRKLLEEIDDF